MPPASPPGSEEGLATPGWGTVGSPLCPQACCAGMENGYQSPRKRPKRAGRTLPPVKMIPIPTPVLETCLVQFFSVALASRCGSVPWEAPSFPAPTPRVPMSPRTCVPRALSGLIPALGALCSPASRWSSAYNKGITRCCWCFLDLRPFLLRSHHPRSLCPLHRGHWPTWTLIRTHSLLWFSQQRRPGLSEGI